MYLESNDDNLSFDTDNFYEGNSYIEALENEYNKTKDTIFESMSGGNIGVLSDDNSTLNTFTLFNKKVPENEGKQCYTSCECLLYDEYLKEESLNNLVKYMLDEKEFNLIIQLDMNTIEEYFESEFKMWFTESKKIESSIYDNEFATLSKPKRDLRIKFIDNLGNENYALLKDSSILKTFDVDKYVINVKRISFINSIN